jgi:hypothetical protein
MPNRNFEIGPSTGGAPAGAANTPNAAIAYVDGSTFEVVVGGAASGTTANTLLDKTTAQTITGAKTFAVGSIINSEVKVLAADAVMSSADTGSTLTTLTGMSWSVVAGATYRFRFHGTTIMTTNCGLKMAFKLTTATLTSLAIRTYQTTDTDNSGAISTAFTTTTDQATWFGQNSVNYTHVRVDGTMVILAAGTIAVQAAQNSAHADLTKVLLGSYAELTRVL